MPLCHRAVPESLCGGGAPSAADGDVYHRPAEVTLRPDVMEAGIRFLRADETSSLSTGNAWYYGGGY
jgi:hypothetical protein